jgi:hypothetical protein
MCPDRGQRRRLTFGHMNAGTDPHPRRRRGHHRITNPAQPPTPLHTPHPGSHHRQHRPTPTLALLATARYHPLPLNIGPAVANPEKHRLDERNVAFWAAASPGARQELVAEDAERFFVPRFGGYDWVGMRLDLSPDGPDWQEVAEILTDAYRQVAPKFLIARLD